MTLSWRLGKTGGVRPPHQDFRLSASAAAAPIWAGVAATGYRAGKASEHYETLPSSGAWHVFVPRAHEDISYDDDGDLTQDGRWTYTWEGKNRLIGMETIPAAVFAPGAVIGGAVGARAGGAIGFYMGERVVGYVNDNFFTELSPEEWLIACEQE